MFFKSELKLGKKEVLGPFNEKDGHLKLLKKLLLRIFSF